MANLTPRRTEEFRPPVEHDDFVVSELISEAAGAHSPYGNVEFPLPVDELFYVHPGPDDRPNLAGGY